MLERIIILFILSIALCGASNSNYKVDEFKKIEQNEYFSRYSGIITIKGIFRYSTFHEDQENIGDQVCFVPAKEYMYLIPRDNDDRRDIWFCFQNTEETKKLFGISEILKKKNGIQYVITGDATIKIANYIADIEETSTNDTAKLVRVVTISKLDIIQTR
jgi:hypothetical protein